jgi:zinc transport system ATP-binding protein
VNGGAVAVLLGGQDLGCGHRGRTVLAHVQLAVEAGQHWCVVGGNGSGKSTLVATLLGLLPPLAGRVLPPGGAGGALVLGYVPQEPAFAMTLPCTVAEFTTLGLDPGVPRRMRAGPVHKALATMGLAALAAADVRQLSLGQRRRALVARALARSPRLLVLDEPCASLDTEAAMALVADLERLRASDGLAIVHVTHDLALARATATHVAKVAEGRVFVGSAEGLLRLRAKVVT